MFSRTADTPAHWVRPHADAAGRRAGHAAHVGCSSAAPRRLRAQCSPPTPVSSEGMRGSVRSRSSFTTPVAAFDPQTAGSMKLVARKGIAGEPLGAAWITVGIHVAHYPAVTRRACGDPPDSMRGQSCERVAHDSRRASRPDIRGRRGSVNSDVLAIPEARNGTAADRRRPSTCSSRCAIALARATERVSGRIARCVRE